VQLGASDELARTTRKVSAAWEGGLKVDLTYRGGITYLGAIRLSDGRTGEVQCNDLAMLD
jgi:hypothetical protein